MPNIWLNIMTEHDLTFDLMTSHFKNNLRESIVARSQFFNIILKVNKDLNLLNCR